MTHAIALIVAAGRGHRAGGGPLPKQYRALRGQAVLCHGVRAFATHPRVQEIRVVIHPDDMALYGEAIAPLDASEAARLLPPAHGGATRQESVLLGLRSLADAAPGVAPDVVLIHDGARPLVSHAVISATLDAMHAHDGAIAALPVYDTLKRAGSDEAVIAGTVDRGGLWRAQTPQTFRFPAILAAHEAAGDAEHTDDAAVAEAAGLAIALTTGDEDNLKITQEADFDRAARILAQAHGGPPPGAAAWESRVGLGFDVHRFGPGDHVMLCGVRVPHERGIVSHSDGDVGLHALVDALLGALGAGDIGSHFPPSDPAWRDADSAGFVAHALGLIDARGGAVRHVDVTLICQEPRIGPHRARMVARLATLLGLGADRVSVKATTTERLGFTGRGEGIAAQAAATLRLPA